MWPMPEDTSGMLPALVQGYVEQVTGSGSCTCLKKHLKSVCYSACSYLMYFGHLHLSINCTTTQNRYRFFSVKVSNRPRSKLYIFLFVLIDSVPLQDRAKGTTLYTHNSLGWNKFDLAMLL